MRGLLSRSMESSEIFLLRLVFNLVGRPSRYVEEDGIANVDERGSVTVDLNFSGEQVLQARYSKRGDHLVAD